MGESPSQTVRIGTRGSALALWQANWVAGQIREAGHAVEITILKTGGDVSDQPLNTMGGIGVFTKEIQRALLAAEVDIAVHSLKDLPTEVVPGLELVVVPPRESPHDVLVMKSSDESGRLAARSLAGLSVGARIGTGSTRRKAQLLHARPDLIVEDIRGNVDTRLRKLDDGEYDALILAEAGLRRLELHDRISQKISLDMMVPAIGQGALGIEARAGDQQTLSAIESMNDASTHYCVLAERTLLADLLAGCLAPVGGHATITDGELELIAVVLSADGKEKIEHRETATCSDREAAIAIGRRVADVLRERGAAQLIASARS